MGDDNIEIKILTMNSETTHTFRVSKSIPVPALKERIAQVTGVVSEQQRLICRGRVLKDEHNLSSYNVENGDKLHLVVRSSQPANPPLENNNNPANISDQNQSSGSGSGSRSGPSRVVQVTTTTIQIVRNRPVIRNSSSTLAETLGRLREEFVSNNETLRRFNLDSSAPAGQNSDQRGDVPTPEALAPVLLRARELLNEPVSECLLQLSRQMERHANVTDENERSWIQGNLLRSGNLLNRLGGAILDLSRTLTDSPNPSPNPNPDLVTLNGNRENPIDVDGVDSEQGQTLSSLLSNLFGEVMNQLSDIRNSQAVDSEPRTSESRDQGSSSRRRRGDEDDPSVQQPYAKRERRE